MKAFVSCSLRLKDKQFVDFVESILKENGIEPLGIVGRYSAASVNPTELMKGNIALVDISVIVATTRYEQKDILSGNVTYGPSEMIRSEVAMSSMPNKAVVVMPQQGTDVGNFIPNITKLRSFNYFIT